MQNTQFNTRKSSSIFNIRVFHNWVKRDLINQATNLLKNNHIKDIKLLDLAVGKGGDMNKWYDAGINYVVGFDINKDSLFGEGGAIKRYNDFKKKVKSNVKPYYRFYDADLSLPESILKIESKVGDTKFNIISCQFAIHYFFQDEASLNNLLTIVSSRLQSGGIFIGTSMDGGRIRQRLLEKNADVIGNRIYKIQNKTDLTSPVPYNNTYVVSLGEETDTDHYFSDKDSTEFLVDIGELKKACDKFGIEVIETKGFDKWYSDYLLENRKNKLSDEEKEFSFLNFSFAFRNKL
jgi:mRNA (guanine-N7-)-methyltransferase